MKPIIAIALSIHLSLTPAPARAPGPTPTPADSTSSPDPWFAPDKVKHFFMGAFVQSVAYGGLRGLGVRNGPALAGASVTTAEVALGKELYDRGGRGDPSVRDFTWGIIGGAAASVLLVRTQR